jgi:hypothetical protein
MIVMKMDIPEIPLVTDTTDSDSDGIPDLIHNLGTINTTTYSLNPSSYTPEQVDNNGDGNLDKRWYFQVDAWVGGMIQVDVSSLGTYDFVGIYLTQEDMTGPDTLGGNSGLIPVDSSGTAVEPKGNLFLYGGYPYLDAYSATPFPEKQPSQAWAFAGTVCIAAMIHAPNTTLDFSQGKGCGGIVPGMPSFITSPSKSANVYGAMWVEMVDADSSNSGVFAENTFLTEKLGLRYPKTTGSNFVSPPTSYQRVEAND